jgi:hypothetical protein
MKHKAIRFVFAASLLLIPSASAPVLAGSAINKDDCTIKGKKLYGRVQIVKEFADIKVKIVSALPDLRVQKVTVFPNACGKWKIVDNFPELTVQIVEVFPDIQIEYVETFPGLP